jgi:hypothetical protein
LIVAAVVFWLRRRARRRPRADAAIDYDELRAAEDEVRGLDASVTPDQADEELPDWGPGAGR